MSNFLEKIIYLTENQYQQLVQNNQVNSNYLYITNEDGVTLDDLGLTVIDVIHGGTGCSSFTAGSVLVGNGLNPITEIIPTDTNTGGTLVKRDANGNFSAGTITASLAGNATSAGTLTPKSLTTTTVNNTAGSFAFSIASTTGMTQITTANTDYVGLQIGDSVDKWQLTATGNSLFFRQNDNGGTNTSWNDWVKILTSTNYTDYTVTTTGTGATGTWGISITGNAENVNGIVAVAHGGTGVTTAAANYIFAGPTSGNDAAPSFRQLVAADIPNLSWNKITSDKPTTVSGYGITDAKTVQTAVADPTVPETGTNEANAFIDTISQNTNGEITVTKKNIPLIDVRLPLTSSSTQTIINSRIATIPYANTSNYGVVKVNASGSSTTVPVYIDDSGVLQKCSLYAGATKVTLNGSNQAQDISIYAPTSSGNSGELLISSSANNAPTWTGKGKYFNSNNYWLFNNKIGIDLESPDSNYTLYANGDTYINGVLKSSNDVIFNNANGNTITWTTESDQIRPFITISKAISGTGTSPIFTFSLSTNGGTSSTNLLQIDNAGNATFNGSLTSTSGQFGNISIGGGNDSNIISSINGKTMVLSPAAGQLLAFQQTASGSAATTRIVLQENTFYPPTNNSVSLGLANNRWKNIYAEELIVIGNSTSVNNSPRALRIFNASTNYTDIKSQAAANKTFYLPAYNGTGDMYATHVGGTAAVGDASTPVYVAANGRITKCNATVGSQYQPVYLDQGTFTAAYPVQYLPWSFTTSGHNQILFESNIFGVSTYVLSIVVTSGESNLKGPITWETKTTNGTGQLILQTNPAVAGEVKGYILISLGTDLSSTISGTSSTVNI